VRRHKASFNRFQRIPLLRSFRWRMTLLLGAMAFLLSALLSLLLGHLLSQRIERDQGAALQLLARSTSALLAEGLYERMREVELMAQSPEVDGAALDAPALRAALQRLQQSRTHYAWIGVADAGGTVRSATGDLLLGQSVRERPWFKAGLLGPMLGDVHQAKLLAKLLPASSNGEPLRFVDFAVPLRAADGTVAGVLGVHGSWAWAGEVVGRLHDGEGCEVLIVNRERQPIYPAGPDGVPAALDAGLLSDTPAVKPWRSGGRWLTAAAPVPGHMPTTDLGWSVVVRQPAALALKPVRRARELVLAAGGVSATFFCLVGWFFAGRLAQPLQAIAAAAQRIGEGHHGTRLPQHQSSIELTRLATALQQMTDALQQANTTLEARVSARTAELEHAQREMARLAHQDALTGLANRRALEVRLVAELSRHGRSGQPLAMLLIDIDHFKRVNDRHGHAVGDEVLRAVAAVLARTCRRSDLVVRFGGEEFLLLLPETGEAGAEQAAEKLRAAVAAQPVSPVAQVTVSIGYSVTMIGESANADRLIGQADAALYRAKENGRNRVESGVRLTG
jgi:diguanylate cyclase